MAGPPLWADRFDEEITHLFAVEDAVAERVATALVAELSAEERQRLGRRPTESLEAYQAYCRGRFFWGRFSRPWVEKAMWCFQEATAHDPRYALPHAGLADAFLVAGFAGLLAPREAWALAERASPAGRSARDDRIPEPHVPRPGSLAPHEWDWDGAEREMRRAVELAAASTAPYQWLGLLLDLRGRREEAAPRAAPGGGAGPALDGGVGPVGLHHAFGGEHEGELAPRERTLELDPHQLPRPLGGGGAPSQTWAVTRRRWPSTSGAPWSSPRAPRSSSPSWRAAWPSRGARTRRGRFSASAEAGGRLALPGGDRARGPGRARERALELLGRGAADRDPWIVLLAVDPMMKPLHGHPGYAALVRRVGVDR